jgi:hypothetical protein
MTYRTAIIIGTFVLLGIPPAVYADHSWGNLHWARTSNPFTLQVVDSVTGTWDAPLAGSISDWSQSNVLTLASEPGVTTSTERRRCTPITGKIRACNYTYGNTGWLGIASVWTSGEHIVRATTKLNDTYFGKAAYNTPAWRNLVMCQELAHSFGLDHQDEVFTNPNLGTCMDYTNLPESNQHPNVHDYAMLETIYAHLDATTTLKGATPSTQTVSVDTTDPRLWGRLVRESRDRRASVYERRLQNGETLTTHVFWVEAAPGRDHHRHE